LVAFASAFRRVHDDRVLSVNAEALVSWRDP